MLGGFEKAANQSERYQNSPEILEFGNLSGCGFIQNIVPPSLSSH